MRRKGSHVYLSKESPSGTIGTVVPDHDELRIGTLKSILEMAHITEEEFARFQ
jgi:predicted RNA binding protein YcfA (HicA-like mRNA interferase family)